MNSFMQRCLIIPVRLHAVSAAPYRNATNQRPELRKQYGKCVQYGTVRELLLYTVCEARPCVRTYMQSHAVIIHRFSGWSIHGKGD